MSDNYKQIRILLVDDHMMIRNMIKQHLLSLGFEQIDFASNGVEATELLNQSSMVKNTYDIVFLDWHMPEKEGIDVLKECRSNEKFTNTAIIMLTAEQEEKNVLKAIEAGATSYLIKPVTKDSVEKNIKKIMAWLENRGVKKNDAVEIELKDSDTSEYHQKLFQKIENEITPVVTQGVQNIFSELFQVEILPSEKIDEHYRKQMVCVGRLHQPDFVIDLRFFFESKLLQPLLTQIYSPEYLKDDQIYEDSACEIVNMLCAQLKAFMNEHGFNLDMDLPKVGLHDESENANALLNVCFTLNEESFVVVDLEAHQ